MTKQSWPHIFVSYARADRAVAERVRRSLEIAGLPVWLDEEAIRPGTADWQAAIRLGIQNSAALVVLCSPDAIASRFVLSEIALAGEIAIPIFPIWIAGESWAASAPLELLTYQYVDARGNSGELADSLASPLRELVARDQAKMLTVPTLKDVPPTFIPIIVANEGSNLSVDAAGEVELRHRLEWDSRLSYQVIAVNSSKYDTLEELTDDLYTGFLRSRYSKYTYGRDWALVKASSYVSILALPWEWLRYKRERLLVDVIPDFHSRRTPLTEFGFGFGDHFDGTARIWAVVDAGFEQAAGIFTSDEEVSSEAFSWLTKGLSFDLDRCKRRKNKTTPTEGGTPSGVYKLSQVEHLFFKFRLVAVHKEFGRRELGREAKRSDTVYVLSGD